MLRIVVLTSLSAGCAGGAQIAQENNYEFVGNLTLAELEAQPETDLTIDWSAVTTDLRGRPFDGTPDQVALLGCSFTKEEVIQRLDQNQFTADTCTTQFLFDTVGDMDQVTTTSFEIIGNPLVPADNFLVDERNWLVSILDTAGGRDDALMTSFLNFVDDSTETVVPLDDASTALDFTVSLDRPRVSVGGSTVFDWSDVTTDVFGNPFDPLRGDELLIAWFNTTDISEIEEVFLQLDTAADEVYRSSVFGFTQADAALATSDADGSTFGGFTSEGTWLVGLGCTACLNPAPLILVVIDAE